MGDCILVLYGSYRADRTGIRLADFIVSRLRARGNDVELIDARVFGLPILDRMFKEYAPGTAPPAMTTLTAKFWRAAAIASYSTGRLSGARSALPY